MQMAGERLAQALRRYRKRYAEARVRAERTEILGEFCHLSGYHRKYAMALLGPQRQIAKSESRRRRGVTYSRAALRVIEAVWSAAGYPWAERLPRIFHRFFKRRLGTSPSACWWCRPPPIGWFRLVTGTQNTHFRPFRA